MQSRIDTNLGIQGEPDAWVHSACILCSNGCGLDIAVKNGRIVGVRGAADHPVNFGHLGPKGEHGWVANGSPRRGTTPMIRRTKKEPLRPVGWREAMDFFIEKFEEAWRLGHENLACYNSGQLTIEEFYTLGKLWRGGLQSSNIDGNTRLCTATSAMASWRISVWTALPLPIPMWIRPIFFVSMDTMSPRRRPCCGSVCWRQNRRVAGESLSSIRARRRQCGKALICTFNCVSGPMSRS